MENLLKHGDYVPDGFGGFTRVQQLQELLQRALFKLTCRRGSFPFLPELGSQLYELGKVKQSQRSAAAKQYVTQALSGMGLKVEDVQVDMNSRESARVQVVLSYEGQWASVEVIV